MAVNIKLDELDLTGNRTAELQAEIRHLRHELQVMTDRLAVEQAKGRSRRKSGRRADRTDGQAANRGRSGGQSGDNIYVFDDEDETRAAFDQFFSAHDPHLDKVRRFLLD